jgi:hypothetical protein
MFQRRFSPTGFFSPAEDTLKLRYDVIDRLRTKSRSGVSSVKICQNLISGIVQLPVVVGQMKLTRHLFGLSVPRLLHLRDPIDAMNLRPEQVAKCLKTRWIELRRWRLKRRLMRSGNDNLAKKFRVSCIVQTKFVTLPSLDPKGGPLG